MKNLIIKTDIFDSNNSNANNIEDLEEENGKNLELSIVNLYSYMIAMTHKHWK